METMSQKAFLTGIRMQLFCATWSRWWKEHAINLSITNMNEGKKMQRVDAHKYLGEVFHSN